MQNISWMTKLVKLSQVKTILPWKLLFSRKNIASKEPVKCARCGMNSDGRFSELIKIYFYYTMKKLKLKQYKISFKERILKISCHQYELIMVIPEKNNNNDYVSDKMIVKFKFNDDSGDERLIGNYFVGWLVMTVVISNLFFFLKGQLTRTCASASSSFTLSRIFCTSLGKQGV